MKGGLILEIWGKQRSEYMTKIHCMYYEIDKE